MYLLIVVWNKSHDNKPGNPLTITLCFAVGGTLPDMLLLDVTIIISIILQHNKLMNHFQKK
jgi:hypothetical protein